MAAKELISTITVGAGGSSSIGFTSIPQTYTDLFVVISDRATVNDVSLFIKFNGSSAGYAFRRLLGTGSSAMSQSYAEPGGAFAENTNFTANTFGNHSIYIPNYKSSTNKPWVSDTVTENNASGSYAGIFAGLWSNTAAITQVTLSVNGGNFAQHSTASLYGFTKGSGGATVA